MSDATAPKKSIITDAMKRVQAKIDAEGTDEQDTTKTSHFNKKLAIKVGVVAVGSAAAIIALKLFTGQPVEDETSEEATTED